MLRHQTPHGGCDTVQPTWMACAMRLKSCQLAVISSKGLLHAETSPDCDGTAAACASSLLHKHPAAARTAGRHQFPLAAQPGSSTVQELARRRLTVA